MSRYEIIQYFLLDLHKFQFTVCAADRLFFGQYAFFGFTSVCWYVFEGDRFCLSVRASLVCVDIYRFSIAATRSGMASPSPNLL